MRQIAALSLTLAAVILTFFGLPIAAFVRSAGTGDHLGGHRLLSNARF